MQLSEGGLGQVGLLFDASHQCLGDDPQPGDLVFWRFAWVDEVGHFGHGYASGGGG